MPAPTITNLPAPPNRSNPDNFSTRADAFLAALPAFVTQINAFVSYLNNELDATAAMQQSGGTFSGAVTMNQVPLNFNAASNTANGAIIMALNVVGTGVGNIRLKPSGVLNFSQDLEVNGDLVYHQGNLDLTTIARLAFQNIFTTVQFFNASSSISAVFGGSDNPAIQFRDADNNPIGFIRSTKASSLFELNAYGSTLDFNAAGILRFRGNRILDVVNNPGLAPGNQVGSFAFARNVSGSATSFGTSISGANLRMTSVQPGGAMNDGGPLAGTWRCLGAAPNGHGTLYVRIA